MSEISAPLFTPQVEQRQPQLKLYDNADSGNAYKVRLALAHLGLPFQRVALDTDNGETRTPEFLASNPGMFSSATIEG